MAAHTGTTPQELADQPAVLVAEDDEQIAAFTAAVSAHLNSAVRARGYDSMLSCTSYAASTNPTFKAEATAAIAWRDAVWAYCYTELAKVQAGTCAVPTSVATFIAELPALAW